MDVSKFGRVGVLKAEHRRTDAFELWCCGRLLKVPWTARRSNQSILKETSPGISLEGMILKLKLQYFGHLMRRVDSLEKTDAGWLQSPSAVILEPKKIKLATVSTVSRSICHEVMGLGAMIIVL